MGRETDWEAVVEAGREERRVESRCRRLLKKLDLRLSRRRGAWLAVCPYSEALDYRARDGADLEAYARAELEARKPGQARVSNPMNPGYRPPAHSPDAKAQRAATSASNIVAFADRARAARRGSPA